MSEPVNEFPAPDELADENDQLSWDRERDGRMADFATDDGVVETSDYDENSDPEAEAVKNGALPD